MTNYYNQIYEKKTSDELIKIVTDPESSSDSKNIAFKILKQRDRIPDDLKYKPDIARIHNPKERKWSKFDTFGIIFIASLLMIFSFFSNNRQKSLKRGTKYTIGYVDKTWVGLKCKYADYHYFVNNKRFDSKQSFDYDMRLKFEGDRFYVEFATSKPKYSSLFLDKRVPSYIKNGPDEGWEKIPDYLGHAPQGGKDD